MNTENSASKAIQQQQFAAVSQTIKARKTEKVLADPAQPVQAIKGSESQLAEADQIKNDWVREAIELAGWAPFHYDRNVDGIVEPWRFHILWRAQCQEVAQVMPQMFTDMKPHNKLPAMLSACGALVLINWLPQFGENQKSDHAPEKQQQIDEEHLAATAVATQNFMLALTTKGIGTYWSSGGFFRKDKMFDKLGIDPSEKLLAAVFVDYGSEFTNDAVTDRIAGKHRDARSHFSKWTREVNDLG